MCAFMRIIDILEYRCNRLQQLNTCSTLSLYLYNEHRDNTSHVLHKYLQMVHKSLLKAGKLNKTYKK